MEQDTLNKRLNTDKRGMVWSYRLTSSSYGVHTRLYFLHHAIVHTERTIFVLLRNNLITSNGVIIAAIFGLIVLYIQITDIKLSPESYLTLFLVLSVILLLYCYQFYLAKKIEKELLEISSEIRGGSLESWPEFLWDESVQWSERILMAKEILKENENIPPDTQDESYIKTKERFTRLIEFSINYLKLLKTKCEKSKSKKQDTFLDETIKICNEFIEIGEEVCQKGR